MILIHLIAMELPFHDDYDPQQKKNDNTAGKMYIKRTLECYYYIYN